ncbi:pyridoxamine 5'-phosphate oxidase family protein [Actinospongicola halichondriae]|uniref:pyridoxamine 5'-phosphate oxidase family protein n=1 Tax=Actinospongicola halichondriae TaxID=3236844 RepID=UPI003D4AB591
MDFDRNGLRVLDRTESLRRLERVTIGRVGISSRALPVVLPVNFLLDGDRILVRTGHGSKLSAALRGSVVAFEVDDFDPIDHSGWSVVVTGTSRVIVDDDDLRRVESLPLAHWAPSGGDVVAISTEMISGRELPPPGQGNRPDHGRPTA